MGAAGCRIMRYCAFVHAGRRIPRDAEGCGGSRGVSGGGDGGRFRSRGDVRRGRRASAGRPVLRNPAPRRGFRRVRRLTAVDAAGTIDGVAPPGVAASLLSSVG